MDGAAAGMAPPSQFALVGDGGALLQQGAAPFGSLTDMIGAARRVVLLLSAADVTLLRVTVPPLTAARMKAALPNLVEEHLLGDPADCVLAVTPSVGADGQRTVAVAQRAWLDKLARGLLAQGAQQIRALPAQLCLPLPPDGVTAAIVEHGADLELSLRLAPETGLGLTLAPQPEVALHTLRALAGAAPLTVYVAAAALAAYRPLAAALPGVTLAEDRWEHWIAAAHGASPDLAAALGASGAPARHWQRWRWPLRLAALAALVNLIGLNLEWRQLKGEADAVRLSMRQTFRAAYPKETVIVDAAAQMRKNIAAARLASGEVGADEFTALCAAFAEATAALQGKDAIAALEYRERGLLAKIKPDTVDAAALGQVKAALAARELELTEATPGNWQIRRAAGGAKP